MNNLEEISEKVRQSLIKLDEARETALPRCRDAIRYCSTAIRAVHRHEFDRARELLSNARKLLEEAKQVVQPHVELAGSGFVRDAEKEYAEGNVTLALVTGERLPEPGELGVEVAAYLNGMGEAASELRRYLLDSVRRGDLSQGEDILTAMDDIYGMLVTIDFPDAITGGLRRTTDMVRGVLEKTRSDLTLMIRQKDLEKKLEKLDKQV